MNIEWQLPWRELYPGHRENKSLQNELMKEISEKHPVYEHDPKVIGRRVDTDDVLVSLKNNRVAVIHLTYSGKVDQYPEKYPWTTIFENVDVFVEKCMKVDALDYEE